MKAKNGENWTKTLMTTFNVDFNFFVKLNSFLHIASSLE